MQMSPESRKGATAPLELGYYYWLALVSSAGRVLGTELRPCPLTALFPASLFTFFTHKMSFRFILKHRRKLSNLGSFKG